MSSAKSSWFCLNCDPNQRAPYDTLAQTRLHLAGSHNLKIFKGTRTLELHMRGTGFSRYLYLYTLEGPEVGCVRVRQLCIFERTDRPSPPAPTPKLAPIPDPQGQLL